MNRDESNMAEVSRPLSDSSKQSHPRPRPRPEGRIRASKACRRCNEKRVKCDASERGTPCTRCLQRQEPDCRLIQSRRGIHARKPRPQPAVAVQNSARHENGTGNKERTVLQPSNESEDNGPTSASRAVAAQPTTPGLPSQNQERQRLSTRQECRPVGGSGEIAPPQREMTEALDYPNVQQYPVGLEAASSQDPADTESTGREPDGSDSVAQPGLNTPPVTKSPPGNSRSSYASSHRNISWTAMFNHLLEGHREGDDALDKCSITYLGESFPLSIVLQDLRGERAGRLLLHHPGPSYPTSEHVTESSGRCHPSGLRAEELAFLEAKGAFSAPPNDTMDALVDVFLDKVFPIYPIVNRQELLAQHKSNRTPWILLHALCSVSAIFCPLHVLYHAGFDSRQQARWAFYSKAKALFDLGYETNKVVLLQVTILMSFWGGSPNDNWNFYSWIGMGVTIAETIGCHRSMAGTSIKPQDRSLLKRLWWVLVLRDTSSAALIGRPFKVNLDHSDVDALSPGDFEHDVVSPGRPASQHTRYSILYQIHATKLTIILRRIITARFQPCREPSVSPGHLRQMLADWRNQLPSELSWSGSIGEHLNIFASTLSTMYNHHTILTYLDCCSAELAHDGSSDASPEKCMAEEAMSKAAQQIALVSCSVVTRSEILSAPHELFHGVFVAAVVFYIQTKSPNPMVAQLGVSGLTNCKLVFQASRETWDPSPWFTQLLDKGIFAVHPHLFEENRSPNGAGEAVQDSTGTSSVDPSINALLPFGQDIWQNLPVLGSLFEMTPNISSMAIDSEIGDMSGSSWLNL